MKLKAYVDGSYNNKTHTYGGGVVILMEGNDQPLMSNDAKDDNNGARMRNVAGEILAALQAVAIASQVGCKELELCYDYEGIEKWVTREWQAKNNLTQNYRDYMTQKKESMIIRFTKIKAHSGDKYNDLADQLAKQAVGIC